MREFSGLITQYTVNMQGICAVLPCLHVDSVYKIIQTRGFQRNMNRGSYYTLDSIAGWFLSKWQTYIICGALYLVGGVFGFLFNPLVIYINNIFFVIFGTILILMAAGARKYIVLENGRYPNFMMGSHSLLSSFLKTILGEQQIQTNVITDFNRVPVMPKIEDDACVCEEACIIGAVYVGKNSYIAPNTNIRGDMGTPIHIGMCVTINDGCGVHGMPTQYNFDGVWKYIPNRRFSAGGLLLEGSEEVLNNKAVQGYSVWIDDNVLVGHQSFVHGPAWIGENTRIGLQSQVNQAQIGKNCYIGNKVLLTNHVTISDGRFVNDGSIISTQEQADVLPHITGNEIEEKNKEAIRLHIELAKAYKLSREQLNLGMSGLLRGDR